MVSNRRIFLGENVSLRCIVLIQLYGCGESNHILYEKSWVINLSEYQGHFHRFKHIYQGVFLYSTVHGSTNSSLISNGNLSNRFSSHRHNRSRYQIWRNNIQRLEQKSTLSEFVCFLDITYQNILLLGVGFEVLFQTSVANKLLFELNSFLTHHIFSVKRHKNRLTSGFETTHFVPDNRYTLKHVFSVEVLDKLALKELHAFDSLAFVRLY